LYLCPGYLFVPPLSVLWVFLPHSLHRTLHYTTRWLKCRSHYIHDCLYPTTTLAASTLIIILFPEMLKFLKNEKEIKLWSKILNLQRIINLWKSKNWKKKKKKTALKIMKPHQCTHIHDQ
jgi:hypothetical protein